MFVHFTSRTAAEQIAAAGKLHLSETIVNAVYAVAGGGRHVPGVQHDRTGRRDVAVLFHTDIEPDTSWPEEVIWHRDTPLPVHTVRIVSEQHAVVLLDGSAGIPDDGIHHPAECVCPGCTCYRTTCGYP